MIKNLILDFGRVLVDYDFDLFFKQYIPDPERRRALGPILNNEQVQKRVDKEEIPFAEIIGELIERHPDFASEMRHFLTHYDSIVTGEVPGMRDLLIRLKERGFKLYGLTNWCSMVYRTMEQYEIFSLLDGYVISSEEKVIKPEPEIYQRLFEKFSLKPEECLFADDREENIEGGRRLGMPGIVFRSAAQYEEELKQYI